MVDVLTSNGGVNGARRLIDYDATAARALLDNPPDGVVLSALDPDSEHKLISAQLCHQMYEEAFIAAGGMDAMESVMPLAKQLEADMAEASDIDFCDWGRSWQAVQMGAFQSYDLDFLAKTLGEADVGGKGPVRRHGERVLEQLGDDIVDKVCSDVHLLVAEPKKKDRARVKVAIKYGVDCTQLCDLNRATLVCPDIDRMYAVAHYIFKRFGPRVCLHDVRLVEWEDRYQLPMHGGYRHLQAVMCIGASLWEIQLNTAAMDEAKHKAGHKLYKTTRFIREMILFCAMEGDHEALAELLEKPGVQKVANPNAVRDKNGLSALHHAAFRGDVDVMQLLFKRQRVEVPANAWAMDHAERGGLALNYALVMCHYQVARELVDTMTA